MANRWPKFALAAIFASAPFQNDLSLGGPVRFSLAEVNLALAALVFLLHLFSQRQQLVLGPLALPISLYLGVCLLSSISDFRGTSTMVSFVQMATYLVVDVFVFSLFAKRTADYRTAFIAVLITCTFLAIVAIVTRSNYILGLNKNGLGGSLSFGTVIGAELWFASKEVRTRRLLLFATGIITMGLIISLSRGSWLGAIAGILTASLLRQRFKFMVWSALALIPFIAICWNLLPDESREFATGFETHRVNISARFKSIDFAREKFYLSPIIGEGVGLRKEFDATNIVMMILAETGILGLAGFMAIHFGAFAMIISAKARVTESEPGYSILILCGALLIAKLGHGLVDHYWSRGDLMLAWGAAGMATRVYLVSQKRASPRRLVRQPRRSQSPVAAVPVSVTPLLPSS